MTAGQVLAFLACVLVASSAQSITGFALALILLGLTSVLRIVPLPDVANVAMVLSLASACVSLQGAARRSVDLGVLRPTAWGTLLGVPVGVALLGWLSTNVVALLRLLLGLTVIACALVVLLRTRPLPRRSPAAVFSAFGALSGLLGGLFSASGPPLVFQLYRQPLALDVVRDTLVATLAVGSLLRLVLVVGSGQFSAQALLLSVLSVPLAMGVTWVMRRHPPPLSRTTVLRLVCALLVLTGAGLVGPALTALAG